MFVKDNTLASAKVYFFERLPQFSESELRSMWWQIICKRFNWRKEDLLLNAQTRLSESDLLYVRSYVKRLQENEPFQHILGETTFFDLTIKCSPAALIPRPETEELVAWITEEKSLESAVDICSGSGCIALGIKSFFKDSKVTGVELSEDAIELSKENAKGNQLDVNFLKGDALNLSDSVWNTFSDVSLVVSNPPYIPLNEKAEMDKNVLDFEPHLALFVPDNQAIIFYEKIAAIANLILKKEGTLYFELHPDFQVEVSEMLSKKGFVSIEIRQDLQGKNRMLKAVKL